MTATSSQPTVFLFSGQGSQFFQMARTLNEQVPAFSRRMRRMDELVADTTGRSVLATLYGDQQHPMPFNDLSITHPAIFMVEFALAQALIEAGVIPTHTLGASLGSAAAAAVSGCLTMEVALDLVVQHARIVQARCEPGAMVAVLSDPSACSQSVLKHEAEIAALNFDGHFVVSTPARHLAGLEASLRLQSLSFQILPVPIAFHSSWIDPAQQEIHSDADARPCARAHTPLMCCATTRLLASLPRDFFWRVMREPIRLRPAVQAMEALGPCRYIDVGPSGTMATFLKYILPPSSRSTTRAIISPYHRDLVAFNDITATYATA
ncbi:MAG: acyltransferase domain-containing protein [Rhizobacter sp.]